jgi:hypothetical protein
MGSGFALITTISGLIAAIACIVASYAGFALRKIVNRFLALPEDPPALFKK